MCEAKVKVKQQFSSLQFCTASVHRFFALLSVTLSATQTQRKKGRAV